MLEENLIRWQEKARREGRLEGRREGHLEGRREGEILSLQAMLLDLLTQRFGRLPARVRRQIAATTAVSELRRLGRKVLRAKSLEAMGLGSSDAS